MVDKDETPPSLNVLVGVIKHVVSWETVWTRKRKDRKTGHYDVMFVTRARTGWGKLSYVP